MAQYLQWLIPALALIAVGALSLFGAWQAPVRNDRAVALQELDMIEKLKAVGRTGAAEQVADVVESRVQTWKHTTMWYYRFVRAALVTFHAAMACLLAFGVLLAAFVALWPTPNFQSTNIGKTTILLMSSSQLLFMAAGAYGLVAAIVYLITRKRQKGKGSRSKRATGTTEIGTTAPSVKATGPTELGTTAFSVKATGPTELGTTAPVKAAAPSEAAATAEFPMARIQA